MTQERTVKGSVAMDMVKIVRALKDLPWDQYLKPEDFEIIDSMILPTGWYPVEFYQRVGTAVYKLVAKENVETVKSFGAMAMQELIEGPYRKFLTKGDPHQALDKFLELRKTMFNFGKMEARKTGDKKARITLSELGDYQEGMEIFQTLIGVHFEKLVETNGGTDVAMENSNEFKEGQSTFIFDLEWK